MDLKKLSIRTLSGLIYVAIILSAIYCGQYGIMALATLFGVLATIELSKICGLADRQHLPMLLLDVASTICLVNSAALIPVFVWIGVLIIRFIIQLYSHDTNPLKDMAHSALTQIYIGVPLALMVFTAYMADSAMVLLALFLMIWINDTGAFLVGCTIGRHKLFERISPKKTWEGFMGGLIFNIIAAILFCKYCPMFKISDNVWIWIGFALVVSIFGTWGDLIESMIKRQLQIKDSGNLIPGHGGILDRIDSLLLAAPAIFLYLLITIWY